MIENLQKSFQDSLKLVQVLIQKLKQNKTLEFNEYKTLLENTHKIFSAEIDNFEFYNVGLSSICHISEYLPQDNFLITLLEECITVSRIFLYDDMLNRNYGLNYSSTFLSEFAKQFYTLKSGTVLTKDQKEILDIFEKHKRIIVSAPTSFGKSRIIEEIIINNEYQVIVIILPTIALLSETYLKFNKNPND